MTNKQYLFLLNVLAGTVQMKRWANRPIEDKHLRAYLARTAPILLVEIDYLNDKKRRYAGPWIKGEI